MHRNGFRLALLVSASLSASTTALAAGAETAAAGSTRLDEVIVTAQRREERLKDVPISVTALSSDQIQRAGVISSRDLVILTPGLRIEATGVYIQPGIRGITSNITTPATEANVATYLDGVYQPIQNGALYELPDVQQIEVLKGPQGTLFGRNATGGAILINTRKPELQSTTGQATASYERFGSYLLKGFLSAPLIKDRVGLSLSGQYRRQGPYIHDLLLGGKRRGDDKITTLRAKLRVVPWEGADFVLTGFHNERKSQNDLRLSNLNGNNPANKNLAAGVAPVIIATDAWQVSNDADTFSNSKLDTVSLHGDIRIGPGTLTTTTAATNYKSHGLNDLDNSPRFQFNNQIYGFNRSKLEELIYSTDQLGKARLTVGGFWFRFHNGFNPSYFTTPVSNTTRYTDDKVRAESVFGEATIDLTDQLTVIAGLRYSHEKRISQVATLLAPGVRPANLTLVGQATFNATTPRVSVRYKLSDATNVYATYSQGFKSGLFNAAIIGSPALRPEKLKAYEVGLKTSSADWSANMSAFYYDYRDLQVSTVLAGSILFQNAPRARVYGADFETAWRVTDALRLSANGTWLDAKYKVFPTAAVYLALPGGGNTATPASVNAAGLHMIRAPDFSGSVSATYSLDTGHGPLELTGNAYYSSKLYHDYGDRVSQPAYVTINARAAWHPQGNLELAAYGRNVTNKKIISSVIISNFGDAVAYQLPATYGVEATVKF